MSTATKISQLPFFIAMKDAHDLKTWSLSCDGVEEIHFRDGSSILVNLLTNKIEVMES